MLEKIDRARRAVPVIAASIVTWLSVTSMLVGTAAGEIAAVAGDDAAPVVGWLLRVAAVIAGSAAVVARVTKVPADLRGITGPSVVVTRDGAE